MLRTGFIVLFFFFCQSAHGEDWTTVLDHGSEAQVLQNDDGAISKEKTAETEAEVRPEQNSIIVAVRLADEYYKGRRQSGYEEMPAAQATIAYLKKLDGIADAGLSGDECTIWLKGENGYSGIFIFRPMLKEEKGVQAALFTNNGFKGDVLTSRAPLLNPGKARRAIILEPFEDKAGKSGDLKDDNPEKIAEILSDAGFQVTHVRGGDAGIEQLSQLGEYDVVYMYTHCGSKNKNGVWMSGERVTEEKTRRYKEKYGDAVFVGKTGTWSGFFGIETYTIDADFIRQIKEFNNTLVYVSGCNSATGKDENTLAKALKERGASAYLGYNGMMIAGTATYNTDLEFFRYLVQNGLSLEKAMAKKPSRYYGYGNIPRKGNSHLVLAGNGGVTIDVEKSKRIELLKKEHRRLQGELEELRDKIQSYPRNSSVSFWEQRMTEIRQKQKEIYSLVKSLQVA